MQNDTQKRLNVPILPKDRSQNRRVQSLPDLQSAYEVKLIEKTSNPSSRALLVTKLLQEVRVKTNGKEMLLPIRGVFAEIGSVPNSETVDFVENNHLGEIIVDCKCETNIPGLLVA